MHAIHAMHHRSKLPSFVVSVLCALVALAADTRTARADELDVVATVPDLAALARAVGGDLVSVQSLSLPTQDPHFVDARPSLALALNRADLLLQVGMSLEVGWLPVLLTGARNSKILPGNAGHLDCSAFVRALDVPRGPIDRSQGDIHPGGNPHYLIDPRAGAAVARAIAERLSQLDPSHAKTYRANLARVLGELDALRARVQARFAAQRGAAVITYHRTFSYLADWLGLAIVGYVEPKPGVPPHAAHVAQLLSLARTRKVRAVLQERFYPDATSRTLAERIPAALVRLPGGTDFAGGQSYAAHVEDVSARLLAALEGKAR
jgi:zinc/manganese transport system substrate-binding protein